MNKLSVQAHAEWRIRLAQSQSAVDPTDEDFDDLIQVDPYSGDPPSKRKNSELARVISILDSLEERGNG